ncbi:hypothetical protein ACFQ1S_43980, partial [Kibdelosporangium lantanae]
MLLVVFAVVMVANGALVQAVSSIDLLMLPLGVVIAVAVVLGYRRLSKIAEQRPDERVAWHA